jgi:predicted permease
VVPWSRRAEWLEEWQSELAHGYERRLSQGIPIWLASWSMRLRSIGALPDAWWLRRSNGGSSMLHSDLRMAFRGIKRRPGFSAAIVLTLSLGIGGTTTMFSVIDPLMLRPLPYPELDRLVEVHTIHPNGEIHAGVFPDAWLAIRDALVPGVFERVEAGAPRTVIMTGAGEPTEVEADGFTPGVLPLLGARPLLGRLFTEADAAPGAPMVALLSEALWRDQFAADPTVVNSTIALDGKTFTVIGVLPGTFKYPLGMVKLWFPLRIKDPIWPVRGYEALTRLRDGVSPALAQQRIDAITRGRVNQPHPYVWHLSVQPLNTAVSPTLANALYLLAIAVACVLLIACVNAANLLMVRGTARRTELAVRRSLGATSGQLFRQVLTETVILALAGGVLGVMFAYVGVRLIVDLLPDALVRYTQATIAVDARILLFSLGVSVLTGVLFGAGPALRSISTTRLAGASDRTMTGSAALRRTGRVLVAAELALSMMLLVGAGLLARSFYTLVSVEPGFRPAGVTVLDINLAKTRYPDDVRADAFYARLKERLLAIPGVRAVSVSDGMPGRASGFQSRVTLETDAGEQRAIGSLRIPDVVVDDDYFKVLGIPILAGRSFGAQETRTSPQAVLIDADLAELLWPHESPIGHRFRMETAEPWLTVIGVAGEVKMMGPDDRRAPFALYRSASQVTPFQYRAIAVRSSGDPRSLEPELRNAVRALDPEQPILRITPADAVFGQSLARQRFLLLLMSGFTVIAVVLAAIGVHGVSAFLVAQRTREIGLRIALGATPGAMVGSVLAGAVVLALVGALLGGTAAFILSSFLTALLFGVQPTDAPTFALVGAILTVVAATAALLPAMRAGRISPLQALRME